MSLFSFIQSLKKPTKKISSILIVLFSAILILGCNKEPKSSNYVARVNNTYLTKEELENMSDTSAFKNNLYRSEIIRNWIDQELLYQQAVNEGIIIEKEFKNIISESRKTLAGAMLLNQISEKYDIVYNDNDLDNFFQSHKNEFKLIRDAYFINMIEFKSEDEAIEFRATALENGWETAIKSREIDSSTNERSHILLREDEIYPLSLKNVLVELYPEEVSIVINPDSSTFMIVQLLDKYLAGTIPPFEFIKRDVEDCFVSFEKRRIIDEYIRRLYADNDIEVKAQDGK
jgi:PBP1b-binding outer membrane lipoprotein LpoB